MVLNSYSEESYIAADVRKVKQNSRKLCSLEVANMIPAILALNHRLHVVLEYLNLNVKVYVIELDVKIDCNVSAST